MTTIVDNVFTINGVIDTNKPVMQNMQTLANACGSWITYDINAGQWAVVINRSGVSIKSFTDSNIVGSIAIRGTGVFELYNKVELNFPNRDILDQKDTVTYTIPTGERFPNEFENTLNFSLDCVNNPVQAELLAVRELKQSRIDKIIEFRTDFSSLGLKAGDLIDITSSVYGYEGKMFRILSISEEDDSAGNIVLGITAFEYDSDVYDTSGLQRQSRSINNGIVANTSNTAVVASNNQAGLPMNLSGTAKGLGLALAFNSLTGKWQFSQGSAKASIQASQAVISWQFDTGSDLDIRAAVIYPPVSMPGYVGYTDAALDFWPQVGDPYIVWAGDNQGTGQEEVAIDIEAIRGLYPSEQYVVVECRGNWYVEPGSTPVKLKASVYKGGNATINGTTKTFTITGQTSTRQVTGLDVFLDSFHGEDVNPEDGFDGATAPGQLMGYFVFDMQANTAQFILDLADIGLYQ